MRERLARISLRQGYGATGARPTFRGLALDPQPSTLSFQLFEDENEDEDEDELSHHWLMCTTVAGGKPLKWVEDAWL